MVRAGLTWIRLFMAEAGLDGGLLSGAPVGWLGAPGQESDLLDHELDHLAGLAILRPGAGLRSAFEEEEAAGLNVVADGL